MILRDAHAHLSRSVPFTNTLSPNEEVPEYIRLREDYGIVDSLVIGYERGDHVGNNEEILSISREHAGLHPLAYLDTHQNPALDLITDARSLGYKGWSLYLDESGFNYWSDAAFSSLRRSESGLLSVNCGGAHLYRIVEALHRLPDGPILISHLGLPGSKTVSHHDFLALANDPRLFIKASGFYAIDPSSDHNGAYEHTARILDWFGPERVMWGSDFSPAQDDPRTSMVPSWLIKLAGEDTNAIMGDTLGYLLKALGE